MKRQFIKYPVYASTRKATSTNNVKRICNYFKVGRPLFVDLMKNGYRVSLRSLVRDANRDGVAQQVVKEILDNLGISCTCRRRGGYGRESGSWDLIIPFADDDEVLSYQYR